MYSVLNTCKGKLSKQHVKVIGATGKAEWKFFFQLLTYKVGKQWGTHQFFYMLECPLPLLGRDLLSKLEAQINVKNGEIQLCIPESKAVEVRIFMLQEEGKISEILREVEDAITPLVWAS